MPLFLLPLSALACATTIEQIPKPAPARAECEEGSVLSGRVPPAVVAIDVMKADPESRYATRLKWFGGAGTIIGRNGLMITSSELIGGAREITVRVAGERAYVFSAAVNERSAETGTVILVPSINAGASYLPDPLPVQLGYGIYADGDVAWMPGADRAWAAAGVGYPWSTWGGVSPVVEFKAVAPLGAPVVNACGELIGIVIGTSAPHESVFVVMLADAFKGLGIKPGDKP
jgi:hypothetical protein